MADEAFTRREPAVIQRLRTRSAQEPTPPTLEQLKLLRDGLVQHQPIELTARLIGITPAEAAKLVIEVGTWLRQSNRVNLPKLSEGELVKGDSYQLFNLPRDPNRSKSGKPAKTSKQRKGREWLATAPTGYLSAGGRGIHRPLAAMLVVHPGDQQLERWMARTYTASLPLLTFPVVASVWRFATLGALDKLESVSPSPRFAKVAVEAWELLELSRREALAAVDQLIGPLAQAAVTPLGPDIQLKLAERALHLARQASWLSEQDLRRVTRAAEELLVRPQAQDMLGSELRHLKQRQDRHPSVYQLGDVRQIREGQMLRICRLAGLPTEPPDSARVAELRNRIKDLGFGSDADQLTPNAVVADQVGVLEEFMAAIKARADGEHDWLEQMLRISRVSQ